MYRVLVGIVYTKHKDYCRPLVPDIFNRLTYPNKQLYFVTDRFVNKLSALPNGELRAAKGRDAIIMEARAIDADYILFLDVDTICDKDAIEKLLAVDYPLVGGLHAGRGLPYSIIGHNYSPAGTLNRVPIEVGEGRGVVEVDGISGGFLLVGKKIFSVVDYGGYQGPATIPGRFTADDEFLEIKIRTMTGAKPKLDLNSQSWHLSDNGLAYQWPGKIKPFARFEDKIIFEGEEFNQGEP
jgi:hypothetical protein